VDAVRIEEFLNYFEYDYAPPTNGDPFAMHVEVADSPWRPGHPLVRVGLKGREIEEERPPCNLVFLIDVSGSMNAPEKIGLVKQSLRLLTSQLTADDRVAIVVYASHEGLVLPATKGDRQATILDALERLHAGGSTNGGAGIRLAYAVAKEQWIKDGVNRVILCTDGDFNVGVTSTGDLVRLAESEAKAGVFLTVLGFGMGNHNDAMLEEISNQANGAYAFIDNEAEARKVFIDQLGSTLVTIAKDVKIQIEFNPAQVAAYRLIGYENRLLQAHEFNDDRKDAGEVGAGHAITALYELVLADSHESIVPRVDPLKYQPEGQRARAGDHDELLTLKLRYKDPDSDRSRLLTTAVRRGDRPFANASTDFRFAASVAAFGMLLRKSAQAGDFNLDAIHEIAGAAVGTDRRGYRNEFLQMVEVARKLSPRNRDSIDPRPEQPTNSTQPSQPAIHVRTLPVATWTWGYIGLGVVALLAINLYGLVVVFLVVGSCWYVKRQLGEKGLKGLQGR
jgi:Ca-activated chloride channel family protein